MSDQYHMQLCAVASVPCGHEHQNRENARCLRLVFERLDKSGPAPGCVSLDIEKYCTVSPFFVQAHPQSYPLILWII